MIETTELSDISVAVISRDPYFLFAIRGLLGRHRGTRICGTYSTLDEFRSDVRRAHMVCHAIVCDLDSISYAPGFYPALNSLVNEMPHRSILCLAEGNLAHIVPQVEIMPVKALLSKRDLDHSLHLAIHAVVNKGVSLVTESVKALLLTGSYLAEHGKVIGPQQEHPALSARLTEIVMWRIFIGLDNADIQHELLLGSDTVRDYVSRAYKALDASGELGAFEALSEWWWATRFSDID